MLEITAKGAKIDSLQVHRAALLGTLHAIGTAAAVLLLLLLLLEVELLGFGMSRHVFRVGSWA